MRLRSAAVIAALVLLASCSSDGERTRPTLPSRTTVASSEPGATSPPATDPPAVEPTTPAPDTTAPGTDATAPVTVAPTTAAPVTVAPTAPPATQPPATQPPETQPPQTQPPVTEPVATEPTEPGEGEGDDDGSTWWPWLLLAAGVIGGGLALALRRRGPTWPTQVTTLLDELDATAGHLSAHTPEGLRAVAQVEAASLAAVRARLRDLVAAAPDDRRALLDSITAPVADLHTAVGGVALAPGIPSFDEHQTVVRAAALVHATSATIRVTLSPPPPKAPTT